MACKLDKVLATGHLRDDENPNFLVKLYDEETEEIAEIDVSLATRGGFRFINIEDEVMKGQEMKNL